MACKAALPGYSSEMTGKVCQIIVPEEGQCVGGCRDLEVPSFSSRSTDKLEYTEERRPKARGQFQTSSRTEPSLDKLSKTPE